MTDITKLTAKKMMVDSIIDVTRYYRYAITVDGENEREMDLLLKETLEKHFNRVRKLNAAQITDELVKSLIIDGILNVALNEQE